jgi:lysophospholipase
MPGGRSAIIESIGLKHESGYVRSDDGLRLFWQSMEPRDHHRGSVALVHGFDSSSDFMLPMMASVAEQGLACYAIDYRGHGRSEGTARHIFRFSEYLADVGTLIRHVTEQAGDRKVFLFGNSLGGLIASHYGLFHAHQLHGAVLTAPFFGPAFRIPRVLDLCARAASTLYPTCRLPRRRADQPEVVTLRWWTETVRAQRMFWREAPKFTLPVLILHGAEDAAACPAAAYTLFRRLGSRDKTFGILPGARHDDLDPIWGPEWWNRVSDWVSRRVERG